MTKIELKNALSSGKALKDVLEIREGEECMIYKTEKFKKGDDIIYIPDLELNHIPYECQNLTSKAIEEILNHCYTGNDFIAECDGHEEMAKELFYYVSWQHPSSAMPEIADIRWDYQNIVTNKKAIKIWEQVLRDYCHCYPDKIGNRPCDNGFPCDTCMTKEIQAVYRSLLKKNSNYYNL